MDLLLRPDISLWVYDNRKKVAILVVVDLLLRLEFTTTGMVQSLVAIPVVVDLLLRPVDEDL